MRKIRTGVPKVGGYSRGAKPTQTNELNFLFESEI